MCYINNLYRTAQTATFHCIGSILILEKNCFTKKLVREHSSVIDCNCYDRLFIMLIAFVMHNQLYSWSGCENQPLELKGFIRHERFIICIKFSTLCGIIPTFTVDTITNSNVESMFVKEDLQNNFENISSWIGR